MSFFARVTAFFVVVFVPLSAFVTSAQPVFTLVDPGATVYDLALTHHDGQTYLFSILQPYSQPYRTDIVELDTTTCQVKQNVSLGPPYYLAYSGIAADQQNRIYIGALSAGVNQISERGDPITTFHADGKLECWTVHVDRHYNVFGVFTNERAVIKWNAQDDVTLRINFTDNKLPFNARVDHDDNIFVSVGDLLSSSTMDVYKFDFAGRFVGVFTSQANKYFVITRDGDLFTQPSAGAMLRYNSGGKVIDRIALPYNYTGALAIDETVPGGVLYVSIGYASLREYSLLKITHFLDQNKKTNITAE